MTRIKAGHFGLGTRYSVLSTRCAVLTVLAAAIALLLFASPGRADETANGDAVQAGKEALASGNRFPWYDRRQDDVRRLNVVPRQSSDERGVQWSESPAAAPATKSRTLPRFTLFGGVLQWIGLTMLVLLLGLIAYLIAASFLKDEVSETASVRKVVETRRDADRVEALPFHVRAANDDFLAEAGRLYEAGRYSEAIVYLFSYELVELDKHHVIRLAKGKTNRQYAREARQRPLLRSVLETTMLAFEDAFFGNKTLSREAFDLSWRRLNEFQLELQREELAAA